MSDNRIPMTRDGYDKLRGELDRLRGPLMIEITQRVATAREMGDLSENAEYHAAREDQGQLQARINELADRLGRAVIVDPSALPKDTVVFGSRVKVKDMEFDEEEVFELVGPGQENPEKGRILTDSPIGEGLLGKKKGQVAEIEVPSGRIKYKILEISAAKID
ncbi:transcription elongation factor GreA [Limnoglobus roseus]|uniref:Transcription elongation factor GreA n=1 Tax=Limnoglobus roseus TaxID=2598579 RepID=A0A5C1AMC5_9BACT|nr:transcription elongation factor GreA [Limnoglobus roseus]QEL19735.1 transcription elongation factor GreA [Limnoglobus roseus]